jgi:putative hemolysin
LLPDLIIVVLLILVNGLFAGAEIAVLTVRKTRLQELVDAGNRGAKAVKLLRDQPERFLATVQIGITVVAASSAVYGAETLGSQAAEKFRDLGLGGYAEGAAFAAVVAFISYLSLVLGELVPKSLGLRYSEMYATLIAPVLVAISYAMRPLVRLLTASSNLVLKFFRDKTTFTESRLSREELQELVQEAAKTGSLDPQSSEIAARALGFGQLTVAELMVPRSEIAALPKEVSIDEMKAIILERGHTRLPVYEHSLDKIIGYVMSKDLFALTWQAPLIILTDILRPIPTVKDNMKATDVLRLLQRRKTQLAIVSDQHGATIGLVTAEDLVEELVGEIMSEHETEAVVREPDGSLLVKGTVPVREINRDHGLELPEGEWTTLAGLVMTLAGVIPKRGKLFKTTGAMLEVVEATRQRITLVRIRINSSSR